MATQRPGLATASVRPPDRRGEWYGRLRSATCRFARLPPELVADVFCRLPRIDLRAARAVSRRWRRVADEVLRAMAKKEIVEPWLLYPLVPGALDGTPESLYGDRRGFAQKPVLVLSLLQDDFRKAGVFKALKNAKTKSWLKKRIADATLPVLPVRRARPRPLEKRRRRRRRGRLPSSASGGFGARPVGGASSPTACFHFDLRGSMYSCFNNAGMSCNVRQSPSAFYGQTVLLGFHVPGVRFAKIDPVDSSGDLAVELTRFLMRLALEATTAAASESAHFGATADLLKLVVIFASPDLGELQDSPRLLLPVRAACGSTAVVVMVTLPAPRRPSWSAMLVFGDAVRVHLTGTTYRRPDARMLLDRYGVLPIFSWVFCNWEPNFWQLYYHQGFFTNVVELDQSYPALGFESKDIWASLGARLGFARVNASLVCSLSRKTPEP